MTDDEFAPESGLDGRLRASMSVAAPDAPVVGVMGDVERRAVRRKRRKRRVRESVAAGLLVLASGGVALGFMLSPGPQGKFAGPAASSTSTTSPVGAAAADAQGMGPGLHNGGALPPTPPPCKADQRTPTRATGSYCGPAPPAGNGTGPNGTCTGTETTPPCGPGVAPGRYYPYTLPASCDGLITFNGKQWVSELPPPIVVPDFHVWMSLGADGSLGWISPKGAVGFRPYVGQALAACA